MIQSLIRTEGFEKLSPNFGLVLVDECHHIPAKMFRQTVTKFNPHYLYGLTATPKRKNNDEKLIYIYIGNIVYQVPRDYNLSFSSGRETDNLKIVIRETSLSVPFNVKSDDFQLLSKILQINEGHFQILIATGQLIGEGTHLENLDCLFLVYPFSFEGKLIQYIGRLEHNQTGQKMIFDYRDKNINFLENLFKKRKRYYNKISKI